MHYGLSDLRIAVFRNPFDASPKAVSAATPPIIPAGPPRTAKEDLIAAAPAKPDVAMIANRTRPGTPNPTSAATAF